MQIPSVNLAASLSGLSGKPAPDSAHPAADSPSTQQAHVEQTGESNPDRDAQGQGDGLGRRGPSKPLKKEEKPQAAPAAGLADSGATSPHLPDEPPSLLDIIG